MGKDLKGKELGEGLCQIKDGRYVARYTDVYGKRHSIYGKKVKEVKDKLNKAVYEDKMGIGKADSSNIMFDELYKMWFKHKLVTVKASSCAEYEALYSANLKDNIGFMKITAIKKEHIESLIIKLAKEKCLSFNRADLIKTVINNIFNFAVENNLLIANPCERIKLPKSILKEKAERQILTIEQQKRFIEFAERENFRYLPVCELMLYTGVRINEALALTWDDVDFENRKISINKTFARTNKLVSDKHYFVQTPKSKTSRREIPLCDSALKLLLKLKERNNNSNTQWVFCTRNGTTISSIYLDVSLQKLIVKLNKEEEKNVAEQSREPITFPKITPHSFRHTFATRCFESGINGKIVQKYLGHSSMAMTMDLYTHVDEDLMAANISKIDNLF